MTAAHHLTRVKESLWRDDDTKIYYGISHQGQWRKKSLHTTDRKLAEKRLAEFLRREERLIVPAAAERDVAAALALLAPHGASLLAAAEYYLKHHAQFQHAPKIADAIEQILDEKRASNCRPRTVEDLEQRWGKFSSEFGDRLFTQVTAPEFSAWLNKLSSSPVNRHNYRRKIRSLYKLAIRRRWAADNIVDQTDRVQLDESVPGILTVTECARLLQTSEQFGMLAYAALGLFCGLRSAELARIPDRDVNVAQRIVRVGPGTAKKRSQRLVPMAAAAVEWLTGHTGPIYNPVNWRKRFRAWREAAKITTWPDNALRHSFVTYHLAMFGDEKKTQQMAGHRDADVLHRHYKALVTKADAKRFWALRPSGSKIIRLRQAG